MRKIFLDLPQNISDALAFNMPSYEVVDAQELADFTLRKSDLPEGKLRIGALVDKIMRDFGASFEVQKIAFDLQRQLAELGEHAVKLTEKEVALMAKLHEKTGFVTRAEILRDVWGYAETVDTRTVESHIHRLNQKIEEAFGLRLVEHREGAYAIIV